MNNPSDHPLIYLDDKALSPVACEFCFSVLNSLHRLLFNGELDEENGIETINDLLMYCRYFNVKMDTIPTASDEPNKSYVTQYSTQLVHFTLNGKKICDMSIQTLYNLVGERLKKSKGIKAVTIEDTDNDSDKLRYTGH